MDRFAMTKFVVLCLSVSLMTACSDKEPYQKEFATGGASKAGQTLTSHSWCSSTHVAEDKNVSFERYTFRSTGEIVVSTFELQADGSLKTTAEDSGNWSLLNDQLFTNASGHQIQNGLTFVPRETDGAECAQLSDASGAVKICTCTN
jgi:hypothetical protein